MTFQEPKKWCQWLPLAEFWYNTSYHTAIKMTPFQALYGYPPPQVNEFSVPGNFQHEVPPTIEDKDRILKKLKYNMDQAKARMKHYADKSRTERTFEVGDMVYLKMQPYRETALGLRKSLKLASKYYGPFRVLERVGQVAYKLLLPSSAAIHPVFHVSQLKKHIGSTVVPNPNLPLVDATGKIKTAPLHILERRLIPRNNAPVVQWLIHWENLTPAEATWEDASFIRKTFPAFHP
ncbi:unnamed protein product [Urochloa humidicola]